MLGFEIRYIGINCADENEAMQTARTLCALFDLEYRSEEISVFAGTGFELMKSSQRGRCGHIAVATCDVDRAIHLVRKKTVS